MSHKYCRYSGTQQRCTQLFWSTREPDSAHHAHWSCSFSHNYVRMGSFETFLSHRYRLLSSWYQSRMKFAGAQDLNRFSSCFVLPFQALLRSSNLSFDPSGLRLVLLGHNCSISAGAQDLNRLELFPRTLSELFFMFHSLNGSTCPFDILRGQDRLISAGTLNFNR